MDFVIFTLAMGSLIFGAGFVVNHSKILAIKFNIPQFIIGATIIAFGTSFPEMASSIIANFNGKSNIALSNIIGSNIFNISLILAIILITSKKDNSNLEREKNLFLKDATWVLLSAIIFILMSIDKTIDKLDAILLIVIMASYIMSKLNRSQEQKRRVDIAKRFSWIKNLIAVAIGLLLLIVGAHFVVESASAIAHSFNISEWIIGIVLIGFGTSLPELSVSISAIFKGDRDLAIGNIIGSNLANTTVVLGFAGLVKDIPISIRDNIFDILTMLIATIMLIWITANRLYSRAVGVTLLVLLAIFLSETMDKITV